MGRIETGVDRLVSLVGEKKTVSVDAAAKELGVSKLVVLEWAEFLSDEGLVTLDYSLRKTYIKEKELSKAEVEKKAKQYSTQKEAFVRKVDSALERIEKEGEGFASVKKEFDTLKKSLGGELSHVQGELTELKKYETMRKNIDTDIEKEIGKYRSQVQEASSVLDRQQKRYQQLLGDIKLEEKKLVSEKKEVQKLEDIEKEFARKSKEFEAFIERAKKQIDSRSDDVEHMEERIDDLKKTADALQEDIQTTKKKRLDTLLTERDQHEKAITDLQNTIVKKAKEAKNSVEEDIVVGKKAVVEFEAFMKKRMNIEKLITSIDEEKKALEEQMKTLQKAAIGFTIASKGDTKKHISELEKKYGELEKRHGKLKKDLGKLMSSIFG